MRYYLAARYHQQQEMQGVRDVLQALGHEVTSRWIDQEHEIVPGNNSPEDNWHLAGQHAVQDLEDVAAAEGMLLFTQELSSTGGYHTELGYALALGKMIALIGPARSIFMKHPDIIQYADWSRFVIELQRQAGLASAW